MNLEDFGKDIALNPFEVTSGYINLPTEEGLGIDLDEKKFTKYPYKEFPARPLRHFYEEGP